MYITFYDRIQWNISCDTNFQHISENMHAIGLRFHFTEHLFM